MNFEEKKTRKLNFIQIHKKTPVGDLRMWIIRLQESQEKARSGIVQVSSAPFWYTKWLFNFFVKCIQNRRTCLRSVWPPTVGTWFAEFRHLTQLIFLHSNIRPTHQAATGFCSPSSLNLSSAKVSST
jgi:hypothetical protein